MSYGTNESGVQSAQPVELYKFALTDVTAPSGTVVASDSFEYADQSAMTAGGWTIADTLSDSAWVFGATDQVYTGSKSLKAAMTGTGGLSGSGNLSARRVFGTGDGLAPNTQYVVNIRGRMNVHSSYDAQKWLIVNDDINHYVDQLGEASEGAWERLQVIATSDGSGNLPVEIRCAHAFVTQTRSIWWDYLTISTPLDVPAPTAYHYTSNHTAVVFGGDTYLPAIFTRSALTSGESDAAPQDIDLSIPRDHAIAQLFQRGLSIAPVVCTIYRIHRPDVGAGTSYATAFKGQVARARFSGASCVLTLESGLALLNRKLPRILVQKPCQNMLYDSVCGLDREAFRFDSTVSAVTTTGGAMVLTVAGLATEAGVDTTAFENGFVVMGTGEKAFIERQDGDDVTLLSPLLDVSVADDVAVYQGCDRSVATCNSRFNNVLHYLGFPLVPQKNPFSPTGIV